MNFKKILLKLDISNLINCIHNIGYIIELPKINKKILSPIPVIQDEEDKMGGNIRYFFRKTNIINVNLHGNMEKINESDILLFFNKSSKNDNDSSNKIREYIIFCLCNFKIPPHWFIDSTNSDKWALVNSELFKFIESINEGYGLFINATHMAGRKNNYDFIFHFELENIKVEFKFGASEISDCPQFLSVSSNNFVKLTDYAEFFYDNYLSSIIDKY
jgi:hypothetical protein